MARHVLRTRRIFSLTRAGCDARMPPTRFEFQLQPELFRTLVLERLPLPLNITDETCACGAALDTMGRHRAACPRSGLLKHRAQGPVRSLARICREAGASVRFRDMHVAISASGLPFHHDAQLAVDSQSGVGSLPRTPHTQMGLMAARRVKEEKYRELLVGDRCRLVVVGIETGGRWNPEAVEFVDMLAGARAREAPPVLRRSAHLAFFFENETADGR